MTDNQIIKALEDMLKNFDGKVVDFMAISSALDLINRQQAEIENYSHNIEKLTNSHMQLQIMYKTLQRKDINIKNQAIKEFAEKVKANKNKLFNYIFSSRGFDAQIDNLVKEMVGEE